MLAVGAGGFQELCLACRSGMGKGEKSYLPPLGLLETLVGVFPEQARGQRDQLATVFQAAKVRRRFSFPFLSLHVCFICFVCGLVWLGWLGWVGLGLVWLGLVWFGLCLRPVLR